MSYIEGIALPRKKINDTAFYNTMIRKTNYTGLSFLLLYEVALTLSILWVNSADKLMIVFLFFLENKIRHFMHAICMRRQILFSKKKQKEKRKKKKKHFKMSSNEILTQHVKC